MTKTRLPAIIISIFAFALCNGCKQGDSDQQGQVEGRIHIVEVEGDWANPEVFLVNQQAAYSLSFADDCKVEGLSQTQQGNGYPVTIGGRQFLLHSEGNYSVLGRQEDNGLQLSTRKVAGFRVVKLVCTQTGEGTSYFETGYRNERGRVFVADGRLSIFVDGINSRQIGGTIETDVPAPWARDPEVPLPVAAPFDGTLVSVKVQAGDIVEKGEELLRADPDTTMILRLAELEANYREALTKVDRALLQDQPTEAEIYKAQAETLKSQIEFIEAKINSAIVKSPVRGVVQPGDSQLAVGMPVQSGQILFLVYPRP